ncbi:hypothetical protein GQ44DRAFT_608767 [Phaeosphaeriaceae sp. PMI808]|nr:hypothetical protein GQ44DRAFT_608767 [Phaeosphaeriaceae sp. PMI808]
MSSTQAVQLFSVSTAFLTSGGIATLSLFDVPILKAQPASRSLPMTRWLFSRGSHIFPTAAFLSSSGFTYLAYHALPSGSHTLSTFLQYATKGKAGLYVAAAALTMSIAPWTMLVMLPTNFALIKMNQELGGSRSAKSAEQQQQKMEQQMAGGWPGFADDSLSGEDDVSQWLDWSGPQEKTRRESTRKQDKEVRLFLEKFGKLNDFRAILMGLGGVLGLVAALA